MSATTAVRPTVGLQLFPYDVADEGADTVVERSRLTGATMLLPAVAYVPESQPLPSGDLPHNPHRRRYETDGGVYFAVTPDSYPSRLVPPQSNEDIDAEDALVALNSAARSVGMTVIPWVSLLNGHAALHAEDLCVVNARGDRVHGWLCPTQPESLDFVSALVTDVVRFFTPPAVFVDRIRFPEWGSRGVIDLCTCFCATCCDLAHSQGVDLDAVRRELVRVVELVESAPTEISRALTELFGSAASVARAATDRAAVLDWLRLRHDAIEAIVTAARTAAGRRGVDLWLDVWPPSYGWLLGQDLARLGRLASCIKPFTYHKLGGGADIAAMLGALAKRPGDTQALYEAYLAFFRFPGPSRFQAFEERGLDTAFVTAETRLARRMVGDGCRVAAGLQLWQVGQDAVREAIAAAAAAEPDALILFCYGWATLAELAAAGESIREIYGS